MASTLKYMSHKAVMLNQHINATVLHICAKIQPTATSTSHFNSIYMQQIDMPPSDTHISYMPNILWPYMEDLCTYMCHLYSHWH